VADRSGLAKLVTVSVETLRRIDSAEPGARLEFQVPDDLGTR
jgi:hypothetical protein